MTVGLRIGITTIRLFPWKEARIKLLPCRQQKHKLISSPSFTLRCFETARLVSVRRRGWFFRGTRGRMNHLLFSSRAAADSAVNTFTMSIMFNVRTLWKVLTRKPHGVRERSSWRTRGQRGKSRSQSIVSAVCELQTEVAALQPLCAVS